MRNVASDDDDDEARRERILSAAFAAFMKGGYAATTTLEIAKGARVSKRALYELVGTKRDILAACISERAKRLRSAADITLSVKQHDFPTLLTEVGARLLQETTAAPVIAVFRLAIAEAIAAPEVAKAFDSIGRGASRSVLNDVMKHGVSIGFLKGDPERLAERFQSLLWSDLHINLLLRVAQRPTEDDALRRARSATADFLKLVGASSAR